MVSEALQQSFMATKPSSKSTLPWIWVIEALAGSNEIDTSLLIDLVKRAPDISDDLGRNAREMVSLRVLESLFLRKISSANNSVCGDKIELDPSERCEDVLRRILFEVSESDLKTAGPELLKWDVLSFITKKRSLLPKCYLQQLKNAIVDSTIPLSASLKERSGLRLQENQRETSLVPAKRRIDASISSVVEVYGTEAISGNSSDPGAKAAKKFKQDVVSPIRNIVPDLILPQRDEVPIEPIASRANSEDEVNGCLKDGGGEHAVSRSVLRGSGCNHNELLPQRMTTDGKFQNLESDNNGCAEPGTSSGSSQQMIQQDSRTNGSDCQPECDFPRDLENGEPSKRAKEIIEQRHESEFFSDTKEYHSESTSLAAQKDDFLNSQCTQGEDFTELNLCVKCNEGGNLLVCSSDTCHLMLHQSCLGYVPTFDHKGNLYCPFCSYSRAIPEYLEKKKEYLEKKKQISLARKYLTAFIGFGSGQRSETSLPSSEGTEQNHSQDDKNEPLCRNENESDPLNHHLYHRLKQNQSREGEESFDNENRNKNSLKNTKETECDPIDGNSVNVKVMDMHPPQPLVTRELVRGEESCDNENRNKNSLKTTEEEEATCSSGKEPCLRRCGGSSILTNSIESPPCFPLPPPPCNKKEVKRRKKKKKTNKAECGPTDRNYVDAKVMDMHPPQPLVPRELVREESSFMDDREEDDEIGSRYHVQFRDPKKKHTFSLSPQLRSKPQWTELELETLKEGAQRFRHCPDRWKKILEFGCGVFQNERTPMGLKARWKYIHKRAAQRKGCFLK